MSGPGRPVTTGGRRAVSLAHGAGGRSMRALVSELFVKGGLVGREAPAGAEELVGLEALDDGAALRMGDRWLVLTTDSHVVQPAFFPGGDIGRLAVAGTVNDLAVMGAVDAPALALGLIVEEGFPVDDLERVRDSVREACGEAGATVVTGDTKVLPRGELDGIVLHTTGVAHADRLLRDGGLRDGDRLIVSGPLAEHGFAILAARGELAMDADLVSDVAPVNGLVRAALAAGGEGVVAAKDPTRGGLAGALHEMAGKSGVGVVIEESALPVREAVQAASELLGIDVLHVACEGRVVLGVAPACADAVLSALRALPGGREAAVVGTCRAERPGTVLLDTGFGRRFVTEPDGEIVPRIC